jgi:hypothetical protein
MRKWRYDPVLDLDQKTVERLRRFPREPDMLVYGLRSLVALIIRGLLRTYNRFEIIGAENLPNDESFVLSTVRGENAGGIRGGGSGPE